MQWNEIIENRLPNNVISMYAIGGVYPPSALIRMWRAPRARAPSHQRICLFPEANDGDGMS